MTHDHKRRRFVKLVGVGATSLAGCVQSGPERVDAAIGRLALSERTINADSTLIATWRGGDPTSAITLQWITERSSGEAKSVALTPADGGGSEVTVRTDATSFGNTQLHRHRATFTGLKADTSYRVSIDGNDTGSSVRTAPEELTEPLVFAEGGDVGTSATVPELHEQAASWDPLFAVVGGDLAYGNGRNPGSWITFLEQWHDHMRAGDRLIPLVAVIGNHEVRGGMHGSPAEAPYFYALFDNSRRDHAYWALDVGDYASLLVLDSNHSTPVAGPQTEWFRRALGERTDRTHLMAAYHVPAYPSVKPIEGAGRERGDVREHWVPLLEEYDVDVAFEHDDHAYKRTHRLLDGEPDPEGILYVGDGAWGKGPRRAKSPDERPYLAVSESTLHVNRVELSPDGTLRFRAVDPDGRTVDEFETDGTTVDQSVVDGS